MRADYAWICLRRSTGNVRWVRRRARITTTSHAERGQTGGSRGRRPRGAGRAGALHEAPLRRQFLADHEP